MRHEEAWTRLPDLLDDRDDAALLAHVRACAECQRQLFLLGRVDRLLHDDAAAIAGSRRNRRPGRRVLLGAAAALAVAVALPLALLLPQQGHGEAFVLRTAAGHSVGEAVMGHADAHNASLALTARDLPINRGHTFVLWASDDASSMQVGRFMVDQSGGCRVRFNLPASHAWNHFWVTRQGKTAVVAGST